MMTEQTINELLEQATDMAFDEWAQDHPNLARFIHALPVKHRTIESVRDSDAFKKAIADASDESAMANLLGDVLAIAKPILLGLL